MLQISHIKGGRILDVGCGNGYFLNWMQKHGWQASGVEISEKACQVARKSGVEVFNGELYQAKYLANYFDVVCMNQVLEHVHSPTANLKAAYRVLKPGGLLVVGVPNIESYEAKLFQQHQFELDVPRHLFFFSIASLRRILEQEGFWVEQIRSKTFGVPFSCKISGIRRIVQDRLKSNSKSMPLFLWARYLWSSFVLRTLRFVTTSERKQMGVYITLYARKR